MPRRICRKSRPKKAPVRKYRKRRTYRRTTLRRTTGVPKQMLAKLDYTQSNLANLAGSGLYTQVFAINSLFDPDVTSLTGPQPLFFDQYSSMYRFYRVYGLALQIKMSVGSSTNSCFHPIICVVPSMDTTGYSNIQTAMAQRNAMWKTVVPAAGVVTMKKYYPVSSVLGVSKEAIRDEENYGAVIGTNPVNRGFIQIYVLNQDASATMSLTIETRLRYYSKFYAPVQVAAS